jgi:hypothetical protein
LASGPLGFLDYDADGDLDLFVSYSHQYSHRFSQVRLVAAWYIEGRIDADSQRLFENDGKGVFRDVTEPRGLRRVFMANGVNFGDVDRDGLIDLYVSTGAHDFAALFPNVLLLNGARFKDATVAAAVGHLQKSNGVALGDLDDDGDLDIFCQLGGWYQDDSFTNVVFENPGDANHWLTVDLDGERDNRFGIGARITVRVRTPQGEREMCRTVGSGASHGCNPLRAHFGLLNADEILWVEVRWPAGGEGQRVAGVPLDVAIRIRQGATTFERRAVPR